MKVHRDIVAVSIVCVGDNVYDFEYFMIELIEILKKIELYAMGKLVLRCLGKWGQL